MSAKTSGILGMDDVRRGYSIEADAVVIGSGPGGFVAADNLAASGMKVVIVEAGPEVKPETMREEAPMFLAKHYWEGGLRMVGGSSPNPMMAGRCLGGSSVVNSAIMLPLPQWVRDEWSRDDRVGPVVKDPSFDRAFDRVFERTSTAPTPMTVMGRRNTLMKEALEAAGFEGKPLPRAVKDCGGCGSCITGCADGAKQSVDRAYLPTFLRNGGVAITCSVVDEVLVENGKAVGVRGHVVDIETWKTTGHFTVRAPRVIMAAGVAHTPVVLQNSGLTGGGLVGKSLYVHLSSAGVAMMDEVVDPWHGATQGWGAFSPDIRGLKYEALWAAPSLIALNWGGIGAPWLKSIQGMRHASVFALVYKGRVKGSVGRRFGGLPRLKIHIPKDEIDTLMRGLKTMVDGFFRIGARTISTSVFGMPEVMRSSRDAEPLLSKKVTARDCHMTFNHMFGSCRMSADPKRGPVDLDGRLRGVQGVWVADSSVFPGPSAVNPQATVMAFSDVISRKVAGIAA